MNCSKRTAAIMFATLTLLVPVCVGQQTDWISGIRNKPVLDPRQYNFTQQPGGSLIVGSNSITLAPGPVGVNAAASGVYVYLSGGTGTAEAVPVTGGTCNGTGQSSCSVTVTCAFTHTGAWTVKSATGGIQEAINVASTTAGAVFAPAGTYSLQVAIQLPTNMTLGGAGEGQTILTLPNSVLAPNAKWQIPGIAGQYCVICLASGGTYQHVKDLTIDTNGANQTWFYYAEINSNNPSHATIERVTIKNHTINGGTGVMVQFIGHSPLSANTDNLMFHVTSIGIANCTVPNGGGAFYIEGTGNNIISSYATNYCDSPYVLAQCDHCGIYDSVADLGTGQMATPTFSIEGATNSIISGSHCAASGTNANRTCYGLASTVYGDGRDSAATGNVLVGNTASHVFDVAQVGNNIGGSVKIVANTLIEGLQADSVAGNGVFVSQYVNGLDVAGSSFTSVGIGSGSGISIQSTGSNVVQNVYLRGLKVDHFGTTTGAVFIRNTTTGAPVSGLKITDSFLGDTNGSPSSGYGIWIQPGTVTDATITGNTFSGNVNAPLFFQNTWSGTTIIGPNNTGTADSGVAGFVAGANVASANSITPTGRIFHVTGAATIGTINWPVNVGGCITMIPDVGSTWTTATGGNIALGSTAVVNKALTMCLDPGTSKWYPSY